VTTVWSRSSRTVCTSPEVAEVPELTMARVEGLIEAVAEIVRRHGAKRTDGRQRAGLGAAERVVVAMIVNVLSFEATRQADVLHEHIARIHAFSVAWV
jgi:hypothetical protein